MRKPLVLLFVFLTCSCRPAGESPATDSRVARAVADGDKARQVTTVARPTLISAFVTSHAEPDSNEDVNEALSDYQEYLSRAVPILEAHGVQVVVTNDSIVRWRDSLGVHAMPAWDSGGILYLFVRANGTTRSMRSGVELDGSILSTARAFFGLPIPTQQNDSR